MKYDGVPVDESVDEILLPTCALFPIPVTITLPFVLCISFTALIKFLLNVEDKVFILSNSFENALFALLSIYQDSLLGENF